MSIDPTDPSGTLLVPVLDLTAGTPDPVSTSSWHMALSNLVAADIPHQIFGLWVYPERGGAILLGPEALAQDRLAVPLPEPQLTQDQLFELEDTLRRAKYASAAAVPVRNDGRDVGLILVGTFESGSYGAAAARLLRQLAERLAPSLAALSTMVVAPADPAPLDDDLNSALLSLATDAPTGPELVRRLSGLLHPHIPHDRLEILAFANGAKTAVPLSGSGGRRRWGSAANTWQDVVALISECLGPNRVGSIANLASEAPGLSLPGGSGGHSRIGSVLGARLSLGGEVIGMVVLGHAAQSLYRDRDESLALQVARIVAPRVAAFRLESEAQGLRGQLEVLQAPSLPVLRAAEALAGTAHLGEALHKFAAEVGELVSHDQLRFELRISDTEYVELTPDVIRPLPDLPVQLIADSGARSVLEDERSWTLIQGTDREGLAVSLRVAGRVIGAMVLDAERFSGSRDAAAVAQQFAAVAAPHLELIRRGTTTRYSTLTRRS
ncbi:MAG: GAF domain-containing protein [Gemmatimonadales bacterium]